MGGLVVSLTQTLVVPVLPTLPGTLQVSASTASWLVTITVVVAAACNPVLGRLGDQFGVRRMILLAQAMFITGSLVCALTTNISILILGRGLQGISTAAIPLSISLIARLLGPERRTSAIALVSAMLGIGGAIGLPLAGLISQAWGFHALFWVAAAIGVPTIAATRLLVPEVGSAEAPSPSISPAVLCCCSASRACSSPSAAEPNGVGPHRRPSASSRSGFSPLRCSCGSSCADAFRWLTSGWPGSGPSR
ncbi:MFS transporter [Nocardioides houyundeii]|uniref:MFS transporter n=1 Tax=Nocardioides houyundeii TaxID=2045452 RepID=UPI00131517F6|nr:MFS transporter [Nocardioides houyundeii]